MQKLLLLADEAIALGAIDGGLSGVYAYPGTPSTEITEFIQMNRDAQERGIHSKWSANEKTAMEAAMGMSFAGKRAMVCMKHVGLNVAADPFMNAAITGVNGGVLVLSADDPSMHSSQNEQDSRYYAKFALVPCLEPSNQQEAYDMAYYGFELSEKLGRPIVLRITTRLAHSRSGVVRKEPKAQNKVSFSANPKQFILLPAIAKKNYADLLASQPKYVESSENSPFNQYFDGENKKRGIIACGVTYNYLMENKELINGSPVLKIGQYPLPRKQVEKIMNECESILCIEEGYPLIEELIKGYLSRNITVNGRLDGTLPRQGELNPDSVAAALSGKKAVPQPIPEVVKMRPPALCQGCGHRDMYEALLAVVKTYPESKVFGDIGCYTLGALPPYGAISSCLDMGASITMAKGAADAGVFPAVAVIGDSTFTHSGITGLLDAVNENANITVVISDNLTTGMTGGQDSAGTGKLEDICRGVGVAPEHVRVVVPLKKNFEEMTQVIREEIEYKGVSVIIPRRECLQTLKRKKK